MKSKELHILLIDDDEDDFVNIRDLFSETRSPFHLTWKSSYLEGFAALKSNAFDVCLLDYRLGEFTGLDLLKDAQKFGIGCPIIFLTGQGDLELDLQAMEIGAADYLVKDQLTALLLERSVRYAMKHNHDMVQLNENRAQILQQDRLASLGLLASSLAHEIGTPMGIIRSRAELVEKKVVDQPALKENMQIIISQIDKITQLVNSLLHLARGRSTDQATAVRLNHVLQDVLTLVKHELDRKEIKFKNEILTEYTVKAESGSLGQVLLNLFVNAIHAIEDAKKTAPSKNHVITLRAEEKESFIKIYFQDTGCGIPEENLSQIFKPFFTTKEIGTGTGLGLATSYKLVHSWGGSIVAQNNLNGLGASIELTLCKYP